MPTLAFGQVVVSNDITTNTTWTANNTYQLDGLIFVNNGATLTIEPGTVIQGREQSNITTGDGASALIIRRGAQIQANGTATNPIIFTSEFDDVSIPDDLTEEDRGLWGGVILLGRATTNQPTTDNQIEGIPSTEDATYGGTDDADNSGSLRYVSIRHGGFSISGVAGDEINGLTMGAVGSSTTVEYVEVYANLDDCYEWFGGTVNTRYLVGAFCGDDTFDYDQGFRGKHQFWFSIQASDAAGRAGEHDGGDTDPIGTPYSIPLITNVTYIGSGVGATPTGDGNDRTFAIRDNAGGKYYNSIFTDFAGVAIDIDDDPELATDSNDRFADGDLVFAGNIFFGYGGGSTFAELVNDDFADAQIASENELVDPQLAGISRTANAGLDPRPSVGSPALMGAVAFDGDLIDPFFARVDYRGAFGRRLWIDSWTALDQVGYLGRISSVAIEQVDAEIPMQIALTQNYPNPFNPSTAIEFSLNQAQDIRLTVYDLMGREVVVLAQGTQPAGTFRVTFDASAMASGLYLYRLDTESGSLTKKMMLVK
jgi:hypothetical protein